MNTQELKVYNLNGIEYNVLSVEFNNGLTYDESEFQLQGVEAFFKIKDLRDDEIGEVRVYSDHYILQEAFQDPEKYKDQFYLEMLFDEIQRDISPGVYDFLNGIKSENPTKSEYSQNFEIEGLGYKLGGAELTWDFDYENTADIIVTISSVIEGVEKSRFFKARTSQNSACCYALQVGGPDEKYLLFDIVRESLESDILDWLKGEESSSTEQIKKLQLALEIGFEIDEDLEFKEVISEALEYLNKYSILEIWSIKN
jgi:hypothetical protein